MTLCLRRKTTDRPILVGKKRTTATVVQLIRFVSRDDDDVANTLLLAHASERFTCVTQRVTPIYNGRDTSRFEQLSDMDQIAAP